MATSIIPVRIIEDTIYIDYDNIFKYTPDGFFLKQLFHEGPGPKEAKKYKGIHAVFNKTGRYVVFSNANKGIYYSRYSFDGDFLPETDIMTSPHEMKHILAYFGNYEIYYYEYYINSSDIVNNLIGPNIYYVMNLKDSSIVYQYPSPIAENKIPIKNARIKLMHDKQIIQTDTVLWFGHYAIDTLFSTTDFRIIRPRYIFKTNRTFMNFREYANMISGDFDMSRAQSVKIITSSVPLPDGSLLYTINNKLGYADNAGTASDYSDKPIINDIDNHLKTVELSKILDHRSFYIYKNNLYILVEAFRFFEEDCTPPFDDLTEESNPVLLKIKLKN